MTTNFFFDDCRLYARENLEREYGRPEVVEDSVILPHDNMSLCAGFPNVWYDEENGIYHMFYQGIIKDTRPEILISLAAVSKDGIHWEKRRTAQKAGIKDPRADNQLIDIIDAELAFVLEDKLAPPEERLKAFMGLYDRDTWHVKNILYTSPDGIRWTLKEGVRWHDRGAEPGAGGFYSEITKSYVIAARPDWGVRRICVSETKDFEHYTTPMVAIATDALDDPLSETYGLPSFEYKGMYLGFLWLYHTPPGNGHKYWGGTMDAQLVYSFNGLHWQRCLRKPLFDNSYFRSKGLVFPTGVIKKDGELLIYASASEKEHGYGGVVEGSSIFCYRLREDGFVCLTAKDGVEGRASSRHMQLQGDKLFINLKAKKATFALRDKKAQYIEGFTHENCVPFSGDSIKHEPKWQGRDLKELGGEIIALEIKLTDGSLYSFSGDFINLMLFDIQRIALGEKPDNAGY